MTPAQIWTGAAIMAVAVVVASATIAVAVTVFQRLAARLYKAGQRRYLQGRGWCFCEARPFCGVPHKHYGRYAALR